jgi:hypothetical protein
MILMSPPDGTSEEAPAASRPIRIEPATAAANERVFAPVFHHALLALTALVFAAGVLLVWVFGYTFWVLLESLVRAGHWGHGRSIAAPLLARLTHENNLLGSAEGWPLDMAILLGFLATAASLYLAFDHLALLGNGRARRKIRRKVGRLMPEAPEDRFFVEVRATIKRPHLGPDVGCLLCFPDRLVFVGDVQKVTLPRDQITGEVALRRSRFGLTGTWVVLGLAPPWGRLYLLARDDSATLSGTDGGAHRLAAALTRWMRETGPPVPGQKDMV